jgi:hypothetical protein
VLSSTLPAHQKGGLNQHRMSMQALCAARPYQQEQIASPLQQVQNVPPPAAAAPTPHLVTLEQMQDQVRLAIEAERATRAREDEARQAKEAAAADKKAIEQLLLEVQKLRDSEAEKKAAKQLIVAKAAEIPPTTQKMEVVGGYILAAVVVIVAITLMQNGNATPRYIVQQENPHRRSDSDDLYKLYLMEKLHGNQMQGRNDQLALPASPTVVPQSSGPYFVSWGTLCIVCAIYVVIMLCFQCLAALDNAVLSVFGNKAMDRLKPAKCVEYYSD